MHVHVDEPGDDALARPVDDLRAGRDLDRGAVRPRSGARAGGGDPLPLDYHAALAQRRVARTFDDANVVDDERHVRYHSLIARMVRYPVGFFGTLRPFRIPQISFGTPSQR